MKVSRKWLGNFFDTPLPEAGALADALTFHAFEIDGVDPVREPAVSNGAGKVGEVSDYVLDVKVTPNRGHDCLSHRGIAKELSAILNIPLTRDPFALEFDLSKKTNEVTVSVENSKLCPRYIAGYIKGVKIGPSPEWLKSTLESIGQRSVNNIVDATNLTMFNTGQPLHAFDAVRLGSLDIGVRLAREGEDLETLDKKKYPLTTSTLVITAADRPVGIAGIKGGVADRIDEETKDIILESANFDGVSIRKSSQLLKLRTDASARFEQVLSPELCAYGMRQAVKLILDIAGGECAGFVDVYPEPQKQTPTAVSVEKINKILGTNLTGADVADVFKRLGFVHKEQDGVFEVQPPMERLDIGIPEDLVEEVGRIVGYEKIPSTELPAFPKKPEVNKNFYAAEHLRQSLISEGYSEVFSSVFADKGERVVLNKVDGVRPYLRDSLSAGLKEAVTKNVLNRIEKVKIFEIGTVWKDGKEEIVFSTGTEGSKIKEDQSLPIPDELPSAYEDLPLSKTIQYKPFSKFPYIARDIALWVSTRTESEEVISVIQKTAGELCARVELFDTFEKNGKVSLAFHIVFQSFERTLEDAEVNKIMEKVTKVVAEKGWEVR